MCKGLALHLAYIVFFFILSGDSFSHGGVFIDDDQCVIQIGFFKAHFTAYQPEKNANKEFCEDLPHVSETLFVLDYLHDSLKQMPVDFRIIKNPTNRGRSTRWEDIAKLENIDHHTVFYQPSVIARDAVLTAEHVFFEDGNYIGIVTTKQAGIDKVYRAIFPFHVGANRIGYLLPFLALLLLVEIYYLYSNGTLLRLRNKFYR